MNPIQQLTQGNCLGREHGLGELGIRALGHRNMYNSKFKKRIRIKESQLNWLKKHKPKEVKTLAGFLDIIINEHINGKNKHKK